MLQTAQRSDSMIFYSNLHVDDNAIRHNLSRDDDKTQVEHLLSIPQILMAVNELKTSFIFGMYAVLHTQ